MKLFEKLKMLASIAKKQDCKKLYFRFDSLGNWYVIPTTKVTVDGQSGTIEIEAEIPFNIVNITRVSLYYCGEELYTGMKSFSLNVGDLFHLTFSFPIRGSI
jgi:hypothetical protein